MPGWLLRTSRKRPAGHRAAKQRDKFAQSQSIE
jgi:hypothetical protein